MSLKQDELRNPRSCLNKALADEPIFVLRAKDPLAPQTLRLWAAMARVAHEQHKIIEALDLAEVMEKWHTQQFAEVVATPSTVENTARPGGIQYR
jgi:hypothetical protein